MSCELNLRYRLTGTDDEQMYKTTLQCLADAIAVRTQSSQSSTSGGGSTGPTGPMGLPGSNGAVGPTGPIGPTGSFVASYESLVLNSTVQQLSPSNAYTFLSSCISAPVLKGEVQWGGRIGGFGVDDFGHGITYDGNGGVYIIGYYNSTNLIAYHSNGCASSVGLVNGSGSVDVYIVKYNTMGDVQWGARMSGTGYDAGYQVASDGNGGIYITGFYDSTCLTVYHSNGCASSVNLSNNGQADVFLIKYSMLGDVQWGGKVSGTSFELGKGIASDGNGGVYIIGKYFSTNLIAYHSNGCASTVNLSNNGSTDIYVIKYSTLGDVEWGGKISGTSSEEGISVASDGNGGIYVTGEYGSACLTAYHSNGCASSVKLPNSSLGLADVYIIKYSTLGDVQWGGRIGGTSSDGGHSITSDGNGGVYVTGYFSSIDLVVYHSNGCASSINLPNDGLNDVYIIKYSSQGDVQWGGRISGTDYEYGQGVASDGNGGIYLTGHYNSPNLIVYHANGCASSVVLPNDVAPDYWVYVIKYNTQGDAQWGGHISSNFTESEGIASDGNGGIYLTGKYRSNLTAYHSNGCASSVGLVGDGFFDAYVIKYKDITMYEPTLGNLPARSSVGEKVILSTDTYQGGKVITVDSMIYNNTPASTIQMNQKGNSVRMLWNNDWYVVDNNGATII